METIIKEVRGFKETHMDNLVKFAAMAEDAAAINYRFCGEYERRGPFYEAMIACKKAKEHAVKLRTEYTASKMSNWTKCGKCGGKNSGDAPLCYDCGSFPVTK